MATTPTRAIRRKWAIEFTGSTKKSERLVGLSDLIAPVGYSSQQWPETQRKDNDALLKTKRNWDLVLGPAKQVLMNVFIMFMTGNSLSLVPIMMVGMMFFQPIRGLLNTPSVWKTLEGSQAFLQILIYLAGNLICLALPVYKCQTMGLLPTHGSDWLLFQKQMQRVEFVAGGMTVS